MGWGGQYDAAVDPAIAKTKMKGVDNPVAGKVVLFFFMEFFMWAKVH
jgi:hypothetical protein